MSGDPVPPFHINLNPVIDVTGLPGGQPPCALNPTRAPPALVLDGHPEDLQPPTHISSAVTDEVFHTGKFRNEKSIQASYMKSATGTISNNIITLYWWIMLILTK